MKWLCYVLSTLFIEYLYVCTYINTFLGVLAGIWPCGVICVVSELFQAESLTQVYGVLHELLNQNVNKLDNLSKYTVYISVSMPPLLLLLLLLLLL